MAASRAKKKGHMASRKDSEAIRIAQVRRLRTNDLQVSSRSTNALKALAASARLV